jgi:large subunit ribosomal protein L24
MLKYKRLKKGDNVKVVSGKDLGKDGRIIKIDRKKGKILVEGINYKRKTLRKSRENQHGGIKDIEAYFDISNVMLICPKCKKTTRVGFIFDDDGKNKKRTCKKCNSTIG